MDRQGSPLTGQHASRVEVLLDTFAGVSMRSGVQRTSTADDRLTAAVVELVDAIRDQVRMDAPSSHPVDHLLGVNEAAEVLGIGRTSVYSEIAAGRLRSLKIGRRRLVPASAIQGFLR
jgi:excisionase family DNA binding protein